MSMPNRWLAVVCFLILIGSGPAVQAQVCHDGVWSPGEFCGRDAFTTTGFAEMNHDCIINYLDLILFTQEFGPPGKTGPNLSADLNADFVVSIADLTIFALTYPPNPNVVTPCTGTPLSRLNQGSLRMSFTSNPLMIVDTATQGVGVHSMWLIADGWTDPIAAQWVLETSSNIVIGSYTPLTPNTVAVSPTCTGNEQGAIALTGTMPNGPVAIARVDYIVTAATPGYIKFTGSVACDVPRPHWVKQNEQRFYNFRTISNVGINGTSPPPRYICHDTLWETGEYCGRDAWVTTGRGEMNHDCIVNLLDLYLFAQEYPPAPPPGPNASADLNGDGVVSLEDLTLFSIQYGQPVAGCLTESPLPEIDQGTLAVSFSSNPGTIVSTITQTPGLHTAWIVVNGWSNAVMMEYAIETSPNVSIVLHLVPGAQGTTLNCDPNPQNSLRSTASNTGAYAMGPFVWATVDYVLADTNPAWIRFRPLFQCFQNAGPAWGRPNEQRFYRFTNVLNGGINGPLPPATGIEPEGTPAFEIVSLAPNPFNPSTTVRFTLPEAMPVAADIWSVDGARVRVLSKTQVFGAGSNELSWDGRDDQGSPVASGVYFVRLETKLGTKIRRGVLLK